MARLNINTIDLDSIGEITRFEKIKPKTIEHKKIDGNDNAKLKLSYKEKQRNNNNIMDNFSF